MSTYRWSIIRLCQEVIGSEQMCLKWCEERGLLPTKRICSEGHEMVHVAGESCYGNFYCSKKHSDGKTESFDRSRGTFFESKEISLEKIIIMIYCFVNDMTYQNCILESSIDDIATSRETVCNFYAFCRELIAQQMLELSTRSSQIGGEKVAVLVEELVLGERKFNVGPIGEGTYIFTLIERDEKEFILKACHENQWSDNYLMKFIQENVAKGSVIIPVNWRDCYNSLTEKGYTVKESNDTSISHEDVYLEEPDCPPVRKNIKKCIYKDLGVDKLLEYLYKLDVKKRNIDTFEAFLDVIRYRFPV